MTALPHIQYFLGANSPAGFYSLYDHLLPPERARAIYILKGGPGCGKSTLMRKIGAWAEESGLETEYILCSGWTEPRPWGLFGWEIGGSVGAGLGAGPPEFGPPRAAAPTLKPPKNLDLLLACGRVLFSDLDPFHQSDDQLPGDSLQL